MGLFGNGFRLDGLLVCQTDYVIIDRFGVFIGVGVIGVKPVDAQFRVYMYPFACDCGLVNVARLVTRSMTRNMM
jgi:hypothetical protein